MSVHGRTTIVAAVIAVVLLPIGHHHFKVIHRTVSHITCIAGKPIPASPLATRLHVVGRTCSKQIVVKSFAAAGKG